MQLRDALDDAKRTAGHETLFPGERRTTTGLFSGLTPPRAERPTDARLVHVSPGGATTDFGYPLTGLHGVDRARFGLRFVGGDDPPGDDVDGGGAEAVHWFDDGETTGQSYDGDTALVVTGVSLLNGRATATQYDLTLGDAHLTHVAVDGPAADDRVVELVAFYRFSPDGVDSRIGQLRHGDGVEVFHVDEHDFVGSATGFAAAEGRIPTRFDELLAADPIDLPRTVDADRHEEETLSGDLVCRVPLEDGATTLATLLTDCEETPREAALDRLADLTAAYDDAAALQRAAESQVETPGRGPRPGAAASDLRVLSLLSATTGLHAAGPDFDPYYAHSGGYGYTWFRDDAEIALFLLDADRLLDLGYDAHLVRSARSFCATQLDDGSWPHRVWPFDGRLAPGWANGRLEGGAETAYQADQTASVVTFLSRLAGERDVLRESGEAAEVRRTVAAGLDALDDTLAADGLPAPCENAWEDSTGRFSHTAATYLAAYVAAARVDDLGERADAAAANARRVYDALDDLWTDDRGAYAFRAVSETERDENGDVAFEAGDLDDRLDSASLALVAAHRAYDRAFGVDDARLDRLVSHVETVLDGLSRDPGGSAVAGLARYEGDRWRTRAQAEPKVWTVSTALGANAAGHLAGLLADRNDARADAVAERARDLLALVLPDGPLSTAGGYLPEQFFDDGTPDSATPLGWSHALRLGTVALFDEQGMLEADVLPVEAVDD